MTKSTKPIAIVFLVGCFTAVPLLAQQTPSTTPSGGSQGSAGSSGASSTTKSAQSTVGGASSTAKSGTSTAAHRSATTAAAPLVLKTDKQKQSYAIGQSIGQGVQKNFQRDGIDVDPAILARAIRDALTNAKPAMTDEESKATLDALKTQIMAKREATAKAAQAEAQVQGDANKKAGDAFLADNKTKDGVVTLPSGLQYKVITAGTGPKPAATDTVVCNYRGTLIDGKEFDASAKHGGPASFPVNGVIKGWTEALQLMPVGSKWQLFIPPNLAYGPQGAGADIGPNSTLVFDVELLSIKDKSGKPAGGTN
ncbi:MAG: FKBP-type peptidyl-prolyl cis-trans isomerase [Candidatus Acidiferrales bacterium]|jgi:FKBP-type peptidyl-prolyl cis-trans isomerase